MAGCWWRQVQRPASRVASSPRPPGDLRVTEKSVGPSARRARSFLVVHMLGSCRRTDKPRSQRWPNWPGCRSPPRPRRSTEGPGSPRSPGNECFEQPGSSPTPPTSWPGAWRAAVAAPSESCSGTPASTALRCLLSSAQNPCLNSGSYRRSLSTPEGLLTASLTWRPCSASGMSTACSSSGTTRGKLLR